MGSDPLVCADARRLPFARRSFDLVNASLTVGDVVDLHAWTAEMARVLGRGGHLVYSDFHPSWTQHGWKRTFRDRNGETNELAFAAHSIEDHLVALEARRLSPISHSRAALQRRERSGRQRIPPPLAQPAGRRGVSRL
jgi:ubiquinone/menaquinone biosynthesis C-methylase UbiE